MRNILNNGFDISFSGGNRRYYKLNKVIALPKHKGHDLGHVAAIVELKYTYEELHIISEAKSIQL